MAVAGQEDRLIATSSASNTPEQAAHRFLLHDKSNGCRCHTNSAPHNLSHGLVASGGTTSAVNSGTHSRAACGLCPLGFCGLAAHDECNGSQQNHQQRKTFHVILHETRWGE